MNLAARIETLTAKLHRTILASDEFARQCPSEFMTLQPTFPASSTRFTTLADSTPR